MPILFGVSVWNELPEQMAIHFDINGEPDNFAGKTFVVFGLPVIMFALQIYCCVFNDIVSHKKGERKKLETVTKCITPYITIIVYVITIGYSLGWNLNIRKIALFLVGSIFIVTGNYLPKLDEIKHFNVDTEKARKINRFIGYQTIILGILFLIGIFLPPAFSVFCLIFMIPYFIVGIVYAIIVSKK